MASARRAAADNPPGTVANRSPTMMTAPGLDSCSPTSPVASPSRAEASAPGTVLSNRPAIFVSPRVAKGAIAYTGTPCLRAALRNRRNTMGDSSSGSNPTSSTAGADSRSE